MNKEKWYMNDWLLVLIAMICGVITVLLNYYFHGGHIVC